MRAHRQPSDSRGAAAPLSRSLPPLAPAVRNEEEQACAEEGTRDREDRPDGHARQRERPTGRSGGHGRRHEADKQKSSQVLALHTHLLMEAAFTGIGAIWI